jgi:hypothetical protein
MGGSLDNGLMDEKMEHASRIYLLKKLYPWEWLFKYNTWTSKMAHASRIYLSHKGNVCWNRSNRIGSKWIDEKIWSLVRLHPPLFKGQ